VLFLLNLFLICQSQTISHTNSLSQTPSSTHSKSQTPTPTHSCGNGIVDGMDECDPGNGNFGGTTCCNKFCRWKKAGMECGSKVNDADPGCFRFPRCETDPSGLPGSGKTICVNPRFKIKGKVCINKNNQVSRCNARGTCK